MRFLQFWWRNLVVFNPYNPAESIERLMILLSIVFAIQWTWWDGLPYLVLSSSFALGAGVSMWVREIVMPSSRPRLALILAIGILLLYSVYAFADLVRNYL